MLNSNTNVILTINDNTNYGNRLQNYALDYILSAYGPTGTFHFFSLDSSMLKYFSLFILRSCKRLIIFLLSLFLQTNLTLEYIRVREAKRFSNINIKSNPIFISKNIQIFFSRVIIGSDQVWNYQWLSKKDLNLRLGSFVPDGIPIISYAASFGVSEVSDDVKPIFQKYLPRLRAISIREDRGAELVKEMTGLDTTVVLDPTLMLSTEQWNTITRGFVRAHDRDILMYFLGKPSDAQERTIQEYARKHGYRVRRILDLRDKETYVAGPQDFVELFSKAQYVFTDSYHACCFSILYHKQFTVFNRAGMEGKANMNSRMETLFRLFDLDSVVMDKGLAPQIDYDKVDKLLAQHRAESQAWLDKAMEA